MKPKKNSALQDFLLIAFGTLIMSAGYISFFLPNDIAPGGLTGIATLIRHLTGLPVGTVTLVMNIPLFLVGFRKMGLSFFLRSLAATVALSLLIDYLPLPVLTTNPMLASVFGGIAMGAGLGMILKGGATTGGTDLLASLIADRFPGINLAWVLFGVDALVVAASAFIFEPESAMYALIALYLSSVAIDTVQEGVGRAKFFLVVTDHAQVISERIIGELDHSVTQLQGTGMYSGEEKQVLLCVVYRSRVSAMKRIIQDEDPRAFCVVYDVREALGEGFTYESVLPQEHRQDKRNT